MRRLLQFGCETMREGVIVALIFFVFGVLMTLVGVHIMPHIANMHHIITLIGFVLLLISPLILILTFILSVLPGAKDHLKNCD